MAIISAIFLTCKLTASLILEKNEVSHYTHELLRTLSKGNLIVEVFLLPLNLHSCCKTDVLERECGLLIGYSRKEEADGAQDTLLAQTFYASTTSHKSP